MNRFTADLHVHTALSPCAMDEMTPPAIVEAARGMGQDMIAICDHNSAGNVAAVQEAADGVPAVVAGMEITTSEEVHVLGLFPDAAAARAAGEEVRRTLPTAPASKRVDRQWLMNAAGEVVGTEEKMLSAASGFALSEVVALIRRHEGLPVASHVDRPSFSVMSQLGAFPEDVVFDAIEVSAVGFRAGRQEAFVALGMPVVVSSDSHFLSEVGAGRTVLEMCAPTFEELALAFRGVGDRRCGFA